MKETLLVTGAAGFVGRNLLRELVRHNAAYRIVALDVDFPDELQQECSVASFFRVNLEDLAACRKIIEAHSPTQIVHLAGLTSKGRDSDTVARLFKSNTLSTCNLLEALRETVGESRAPQATNFLLASTGLIYGAQTSPFREDMLPLPPDSYSLSKLLAEQAVIAFSRMGVVRGCIFRPALIYGPKQNGEMFIPSLVSALRKRERFPMTAGAQTRDFIHVLDITDAILFAVQRGLEGTYNVGTGQANSLRSIALKAAAWSQSEDLIGIGALEYRENEVWEYALDPTHLTNAGWTARIILDDGLRSCLLETQ